MSDSSGGGMGILGWVIVGLILLGVCGIGPCASTCRDCGCGGTPITIKTK